MKHRKPAILDFRFKSELNITLVAFYSHYKYPSHGRFTCLCVQLCISANIGAINTHDLRDFLSDRCQMRNSVYTWYNFPQSHEREVTAVSILPWGSRAPPPLVNGYLGLVECIEIYLHISAPSWLEVQEQCNF
jgi:hypothetical protein